MLAGVGCSKFVGEWTRLFIFRMEWVEVNMYILQVYIRSQMQGFQLERVKPPLGPREINFALSCALCKYSPQHVPKKGGKYQLENKNVLHSEDSVLCFLFLGYSSQPNRNKVDSFCRLFQISYTTPSHLMNCLAKETEGLLLYNT